MSMMAGEARGKPILVSAPVYGRLNGIKADMAAEKGRAVTFTEVLEFLLDTYSAVAP